jgi:hypothetical protein
MNEQDRTALATPTPARARTSLYIYGTGERPDGYRFAVGETFEDTKPNGALALFQRATDAYVFAYAEQARTGGAVHVLPSAELDTAEQDATDDLL